MRKLEAWFEKEIDDDVLSAICATLIEHDVKFYVYEETEKKPMSPLFNCPPVCTKCGQVHDPRKTCMESKGSPTCTTCQFFDSKDNCRKGIIIQSLQHLTDCWRENHV